MTGRGQRARVTGRRNLSCDECAAGRAAKKNGLGEKFAEAVFLSMRSMRELSELGIPHRGSGQIREHASDVAERQLSPDLGAVGDERQSVARIARRG